MTKSIPFETATDNDNYPGVIDVDPKEVMTQAQAVHLIDVRRPDEFNAELGHIKNSQLFTLDRLPSQFQELPKDKTIVFICRSGNRSAQAAAFCSEQGFKSVLNMRGGMLLWNQLGLPVEREEN